MFNLPPKRLNSGPEKKTGIREARPSPLERAMVAAAAAAVVAVTVIETRTPRINHVSSKLKVTSHTITSRSFAPPKRASTKLSPSRIIIVLSLDLGVSILLVSLLGLSLVMMVILVTVMLGVSREDWQLLLLLLLLMMMMMASGTVVGDRKSSNNEIFLALPRPPPPWGSSSILPALSEIMFWWEGR